MIRRRILISAGIAVGILCVLCVVMFRQGQVHQQRIPPPEETWELTGVGPLYFEQDVLNLLNDTAATDTEVALRIYRLKTEYYMDTTRAEMYTWRTMAQGPRQVNWEDARYILSVVAALPSGNDTRPSSGL